MAQIGQDPSFAIGDNLTFERQDPPQIRTFVSQDTGTRTLSLAAQGGTRPVHITSDTHIWLDRSGARLRNAGGGVSDLVSGRRAEVKYMDPAKRQSAAWVKVEAGN